METVVITKKECERLKKSDVDHALVRQVRRSLEDVKHGRIKVWKEG